MTSVFKMEVHGKRAESDDDDKPTETEIFCQPCELENITTKADGICMDCDEYMCHTCFRQHLKGKLYRNHRLTDISKASSERKEYLKVDKCKRHDNEPIKFYCRSHEYVGCGDCMVLEHTNCKPEYIKDVSKGVQGNEEFKVLMGKLEQLESRNNENDSKLKTDQKECKEMLENALKEIRKFRVDINKYLDKAEADIITEAERLKHENDTVLEKLQQNCEQLSSKIEALKNKLDKHVPDHVMFINTVNGKHAIAELEERDVFGSQTENTIKLFKFVPDDQLSSKITSTTKLGYLDIQERKTALSTKPDDEKKSYEVQDDNNQEAAVVAVGARVRYIGHLRLFKRKVKGQPGTVTAVHKNYEVTVKWDSCGIRNHIIGRDVELVTLPRS